jgi:hypothetical protein
MTKYWVIGTKKNGEPVNLYVETNDAAVEHDLEQAPSGSLIFGYAVGGFIPVNDVDKHLALAHGAFSLHVRAPEFTSAGKIYETDSIPKGLEGFWCGGTLKEPHTCAVVIYEQPCVVA